MTNLSQADKALKMRGAIEQLRREYERRPDVQRILSEALDNLPPASFALLYEIVTAESS